LRSATRIIGCTIASASYGSYVRVLAARWHEFHPHLPFCALFVDGGAPALEEGTRVVSCEDVGLSSAEVEIRRGIYNLREFCLSLKAELLKALLAEGYDAAVYLDPDTGLYADLEDVGHAAATYGIALAPHLLRPPPRDGLYPSDFEILKTGVFNGGLIAVGRDAKPFLEWWSGHLRRDCLDELGDGFHADQTWLQSIPQYFRYTALFDPTLNVAHWNVHERDLEHVEGRYLVAGKPLRTFHFSQFDPDNPDSLCSREAPTRYRVDPTRNPTVFQLLREYATELLKAGYRESRALGYAYSASVSGLELGRWERAVYREAVLAAEARGGAPPPSPFDSARVEDFERLVGDPSSLSSLSEPARSRLELLRPQTRPRFVLVRAARRLLRAARYALTGRLTRRPLDPDLQGHVTSAAVLREYEYPSATALADP